MSRPDQIVHADTPRVPRRHKRGASAHGWRRSTKVAAAITALFATLALVLTACTAPGGIPADSPLSQPLNRFQTQELTWEECDDYAVTAQDEEYFPLVPTAECARLEVPMDYADLEGDTASVAVIRIPARGDSLGPLLFNPGGPGGAGLIGTIGASALMAESAITERFDLIGFDPRGVGATEPAIDCGFRDGSAETEALMTRIGSIVPSLTEADTRALVERCAAGSGGMDALEHVGTRTTAEDMDLLRQVLGEEQLNFLGQSYGTRLGTVYAEQFPDKVRAMVLDGAFDPNLPSQDRLLASYVGFQRAFESMAAACAAQADCPLGTDPAGFTSALQAIIQPLAENPVPAGDAELDFDTALGGVMGGLYAPEAWPAIIEGLREVQQGRGDQLLQLAMAIAGVTAEGKSPNQVDASLAINCVDEKLLSPAELNELRAATYAQAPMTDPGTDRQGEALDKCADFPVTGELNVPYAQNIEGLAPTLVVSLTGDATTPHQGAVRLAETLDSRLLTVVGEGHTVIAKGISPCADRIAADYLIDLKLPAEGASCAL